MNDAKQIDSSRPVMARRLDGFGTSVFAEISALAREHDAVNLGQGFPDFDGPEAVKQMAAVAIATGYNQYAISHGEPTLRAAIAEHAQRFHDHDVDPDREITVTSGATEALFSSILALVDPGDEVIVFEPFYDAYVPNIIMAGGVPVPVRLHAPTFRFDPDELRRAFSPRTRLVIVNTPHNPTGTVLGDEELATIAELCVEHDVVAISDEVYEHLVYDGLRHRRLATMPGMEERTLTISSVGKTFSLTGWKIGWAIGSHRLQAALRRVHQFSVFATSTPMQHATAYALRMPDSFFETLVSEYLSRRDFLMQALADSGLEPYRPEGSYFIMAGGLDRFGFDDPIEFTKHLIRTVGVASIPPATFYLDGRGEGRYVRFAFCKRMETLEEAARRMRGLQSP